MTDAYGRIERELGRGGPVLLDGGVGSELELIGYPAGSNTSTVWGTGALDTAPELTAEVHRRYVDAGADVITTNTWRLDQYAVDAVSPESTGDWRDLALRAVAIARDAAARASRPTAVAFSMFTEPLGRAEVALLAEAIVHAQPDVILVETTESIPADLNFSSFEPLLSTGLPVWIAYRWTHEGPCDVRDIGITPVQGQLQDEQGELFGRAAARLEAMGIAAILINCLPLDRVPGTLPFLRGFTSLPLGAYPNAGSFIDPGWDFEKVLAPADFAQAVRGWVVEEGAAIVGGCCGIGSDHIEAARKALVDAGLSPTAGLS